MIVARLMDRSAFDGVRLRANMNRRVAKKIRQHSSRDFRAFLHEARVLPLRERVRLVRDILWRLPKDRQQRTRYIDKHYG